MSSNPPMTPGYEMFASLVHERFEVSGPAGDVALELENATLHPARRPGQKAGFTLIFRGPRESPLQQATYSFRNPRCTTSIFVVPIGLDATGYHYEAIFNPY